MKTLLLAAAAVMVLGGFGIQAAHANRSLPLMANVIIGGSSASHGEGSSESGGATGTSSGTTFGGAAVNSASKSKYETNGPSLSDGSKVKSFASGSGFGSTSQASTTNGDARAHSTSTSGVLICAGVGCN